MQKNKQKRDIQSRRDLFDFFQSQMQSIYTDLKENQRYSYESNLIKSYIFEVNSSEKPSADTISKIFSTGENSQYQVQLSPTQEDSFFDLQVKDKDSEIRLYIDASTDPRFWVAYSLSRSHSIDRWIETLLHKSINFDQIWLWPKFLENIQSEGYFRGFGLDYDYRKFGGDENELTTYLKMQLWGGENSKEIYRMLLNDRNLGSKVVLSKVRFKKINENDEFVIQDIKYNGKFTARGNDFGSHLLTIDEVRKQYSQLIRKIEKECALRWVNNSSGGLILEGYAIHFIPENFELHVPLLVEKIFDGTEPFRLLGFPTLFEETSAVMEVVDLHTGGKLTMEIYPDLITIYLPEQTCANTIARLYTNIQHSLNVNFRVETDNGEQLFN